MYYDIIEPMNESARNSEVERFLIDNGFGWHLEMKCMFKRGYHDIAITYKLTADNGYMCSLYLHDGENNKSVWLGDFKPNMVIALVNFFLFKKDEEI